MDDTQATSSRTSLNFITVSDPNEFKSQETKDQIRRLAMTHVGLARRKPKSKRDRSEIVLSLRKPVATSSRIEEYDGVDAESSNPITIDGKLERVERNKFRNAGAMALSRVGLDTMDPFWCLPFKMDSQASTLCHSFFGANQNYSDVLRAAWSVAGFYDDLSFRVFLSNSALYLTILRKGEPLFEDTSESLRLHTKALSLLCQKLNDPTQHTTDSLIGAMSGFLIHDFVIGDFAGWNRHMGGLLKMIELRGTSAIVDNPHLSLPLSWADICGCFSQDLPPFLPPPLPWLQAIALPLHAASPHAVNHVQASWEHEFEHAREWLSIYSILFHLIHDRSVPRNTWIDAVLYRLLSMRPLWSSTLSTREAVVEEVCRIGTLLFLAPMWRLVGIHPARTRQMRQNLLGVLETNLVEWGQCRVILLWTLAHAVRESQDFEEKQIFAANVAMVALKMQLFTWFDIQTEIEKVLCWGDPAIEWHETGTAIQNAFPIDSIAK